MTKRLFPIFLILIFTQCATASKQKVTVPEKTDERTTNKTAPTKKTIIVKKDVVFLAKTNESV